MDFLSRSSKSLFLSTLLCAAQFALLLCAVLLNQPPSNLATGVQSHHDYLAFHNGLENAAHQSWPCTSDSEPDSQEPDGHPTHSIVAAQSTSQVQLSQLGDYPRQTANYPAHQPRAPPLS